MGVKHGQPVPPHKTIKARKISKGSNNPWNVVNKSFGVKKNSNISSLLNNFPSTLDGLNAINNKFFSVFGPKSNLSSVTPSSYNGQTICLEERIVYKLINSIKSSFRSTDSEIPTFLIKEASHILSPVLTHIYQNCIDLGVFPDSWKSSTIIPLSKCNIISLDNLRPISLLPTLSKLFEKCLVYYLKKDLYILYDKEQFGFRPKSSTHCAFISLHSQLLQSIDRSSSIRTFVINFDLSKAFDTINHDILISTLLNLNLPLFFIKIVNSYLQSRTQRVAFNNVLSGALPVNSGVPQGSVLGPVLFCLYIRSLQSIDSVAKCFKYADDTTFLLSIPKAADPCSLISRVISHVESWCSNHKMLLNNSKTKIMHITSTSSKIPFLLGPTLDHFLASKITFVGYSISNDLSWTINTNAIVKKLSSRIHLLRILKTSLSKMQLIQVYYSYIQSLIDYLFPIINNLTSHQINDLFLVTKRAHRIICGWNCSDKCLPDFKERCNTLALKLFQKAAADPAHILHDILPIRSSRSRRFIIPYTHSDKHLRSFLPQCSINFNKDLDK